MIEPEKRPLGAQIAMALHRSAAGVSTAGRRVGEFVESTIAGMLARIFAVCERFDSVDLLLRALGRMALALWSGTGWLLSQLVPRRLGRMASSACEGGRWSLVFLVTASVRSAERLRLAPFFRPIRYATWPLWRPIAAVCGFARAWVVSRSRPQVLWGLPALLMLLPVAGLAFVDSPRNNPATVADYRAALVAANQQGDLPSARLHERKLAQLGVNTDRQSYQRALDLAASGQLTEAYRSMERLAPADECGYPPAHFWIARQAFAGELAASNERGSLVDRHLTRLEELGQQDSAVQLLVGLRLTERGELEAARQKLEPLAGEVPMAAATLLRLDLELRRDDQIHRNAATVVRHFRNQQDQGLQFSPADYFLMSFALRIVGAAETEREGLLTEWCAQYPQDTDAPRELLHFVEAKFERLLEASGSSPTELARLIQRAASLGAHPQWLDAQFQRLYAIRDRSIVANPLPEQVVAWLLSDEATPPAVLGSLGVEAARAGEWDRAGDCFERVTKCDPLHAVAWNNWAWVLLQQGNPAKLATARQLVDRALELEPKAHRFRETRGQIWLRLGEWERARVDLEYAQTGMPRSPSLEAALATVYAALGGQPPAGPVSTKNVDF